MRSGAASRAAPSFTMRCWIRRRRYVLCSGSRAVARRCAWRDDRAVARARLRAKPAGRCRDVGFLVAEDHVDLDDMIRRDGCNKHDSEFDFAPKHALGDRACGQTAGGYRIASKRPAEQRLGRVGR